MDDLLFQLHGCVTTLRAIMTDEELTDLLSHSYQSVIPGRWQQTLLENELLMPRDGALYRLFRRAGIYDEATMAIIVLQMFYLQYRSQ